MTNNVVEYEDFFPRLELARSLKVQNLNVFSDSELIVKQGIFVKPRILDLYLIGMRFRIQ